MADTADCPPDESVAVYVTVWIRPGPLPIALGPHFQSLRK